MAVARVLGFMMVSATMTEPEGLAAQRFLNINPLEGASHV